MSSTRIAPSGSDPNRATPALATRSAVRRREVRRQRSRIALAFGLSVAAVIGGGAAAFAVEPRAGDVPEVAAIAEGTLSRAETAIDSAHEKVATDDLEQLVVRMQGYEEMSADDARELTGELAVESAQVWEDTQSAIDVDSDQERLAQQAAGAEEEWMAALDAKRAEAERIAKEKAEAKAAAEALAAVNTVDGAKATARTMAAEYGWGDGEFGCLDSLWTKESGWNYQAANPSSGAYGIPQSLPGSKMATAGGDWQTNAATQIAWGLGYISAVYGTPCAAWGHSQATDWY